MICTPHQYYWSDQIEKNEMGGACSSYEGQESCTQFFLARKREGWRPLGRRGRRLEDNIQIDLQDMGRGHGLD